mmetsp:Transcript_82053/g.187776  ORF Transcript_82053/g.187776 Transcript_82053/m.187776 type:complete len:200 (+) Transcript_82053:124-723(+)|eukprot:CAMPEP_0204264154 /NCGR_PEP_ID=MMETSP0468-20130131/8826_1 /ASSEMBLY_ACC=CAM_ASM_000383 /TAXON_ID=2969 /ORGANISM="Oxyrrhis marina" /LENGTH=199 /DNA_ID=CAMNT_0051238989 /DNA_START=32 /DNA_END=631 /DNA_ORIENTATION=-
MGAGASAEDRVLLIQEGAGRTVWIRDYALLKEPWVGAVVKALPGGLHLDEQLSTVQWRYPDSAQAGVHASMNSDNNNHVDWKYSVGSAKHKHANSATTQGDQGSEGSSSSASSMLPVESRYASTRTSAHEIGNCKTCRFHFDPAKAPCSNGMACQYCHDDSHWGGRIDRRGERGGRTRGAYGRKPGGETLPEQSLPAQV